jgi:hypothetical protein
VTHETGDEIKASLQHDDSAWGEVERSRAADRAEEKAEADPPLSKENAREMLGWLQGIEQQVVAGEEAEAELDELEQQHVYEQAQAALQNPDRWATHEAAQRVATEAPDLLSQFLADWQADDPAEAHQWTQSYGQQLEQQEAAREALQQAAASHQALQAQAEHQQMLQQAEAAFQARNQGKPQAFWQTAADLAERDPTRILGAQTRRGTPPPPGSSSGRLRGRTTGRKSP